MKNSPSTTLSLLACQLNIPKITNVAERDTHLRSTAARLRKKLSQQRADLVILPELSSIDYARDTFNQLQALSEMDTGASFQTFSEIAREFGLTVVYGYPGLRDNRFTICQAAVGADGQLLGVYEKLHIAHYGASMEKDYFESGQHLMVFECKGVRIAPIICYDIRFPQLCQTLATQHEASLILHCGAYYRDESFPSWHPFVITRAMENQIYILSLNRAGARYGQSLFCPPWMDSQHPCVNFENKGEDFKYLKLETQIIAKARDYPFLKDRLDDYSTLTLCHPRKGESRHPREGGDPYKNDR